MELNKNNKLLAIKNLNIFEVIKKYRFIQVILGIITISIILNIIFISLYILKYSSYKKLSEDYDNSQANYKELNTKYTNLASAKKTLSDKYNSLNSKYDELNNKYQETTQEKYQTELKSKINELETNKSNLETQVEKLNKDIITLKGTEKTYPAGFLTAGKDFEPGRYKIYGGSSNFFVYSSSGSLRVNIILGNGSYRVSEYLYTFQSGEHIEANSSFKMVPIE